jgi:Zn finger protein HypA/HybF involved in hydrogenase expression
MTQQNPEMRKKNETCSMGAAHMTPSYLTLEEQKKRIAEQLHGSRIAGGDWLGDKEPGGNECNNCGGIFIGNEWRDVCKRCHDFKVACRALLGEKP